MAETTNAQVAGLQLSNNSFSGSPPGSMSRADNCVVNSKGVLEPRRGYALANGTGASRTSALAEFQDELITLSDTVGSTTTGVLSHGSPDGGAATPYSGTYNTVDAGVSGRMKFAQAAEFLHFCADDGPRVLEEVAGTVRAAGLRQMPSLITGGTKHATLNEWLPYNSAVAYRSVLRYPTSSGVSLLSPPSPRRVYTNRCLVPIGGLVRTGGNLVTGTIATGGAIPFTTGDVVTLSVGEANFAVGPHTITGVPTEWTFTYTDAGANVASTVANEVSAGDGFVLVNVRLSSDATTSTPVRLYRSKYTTASTIEPADEMFLVGERLPTGGEITAGLMSFNDYTPQSQAVDPLYTNPETGEGALQTNFEPPIYRDVASWNGQLWYSNTTGRQSLTIQMLGVGAADGVQNNDTITIAGTVLTFKTTPGAADEVQIYSSGTPSANITLTTQALVDAIAANTSAVVAINNNFNEITITSTAWGDAAFTVAASRAASWTPALTASSDNNRQPNGIAYSKLEQPEAVPVVNFMNVGAKTWPVARILALRSALVVFKDGDGIYVVTGQPGAYAVRQISTANLVGVDSCAVMADFVWAWTDQGVIKISDGGGVQVVSRPIETELLRIQGLTPESTWLESFAVPYETERQVWLWVPLINASGSNQLLSDGELELTCFVYSSATGAWTNVRRQAFAGLAFSSNAARSQRMCLSSVVVSPSEISTNGGIDGTFIERKNNDLTDYADEAIETTVLAVGEQSGRFFVCITEQAAPYREFAPGIVEVGDGFLPDNASASFGTLRHARTKFVGTPTTLADDPVAAAFIAATSGATATNTYETIERVSASMDTGDIYKGYAVDLQFLPVGDPASRKSISRLAWLAKPEHFANYFGRSTILTDQAQAEREAPTVAMGFGFAGFGAQPFGDPSPLVLDVNPLNAGGAAQYYVGLRYTEAWAKLRLEGFSMWTEGATGPTGRGR